MKVTRRCIICKKGKTKGVRAFTKFDNLIKRLDLKCCNSFIQRKSKLTEFGHLKYVCSLCKGILLKECPRQPKDERVSSVQVTENLETIV
jgi:hypothetical protein